MQKFFGIVGAILVALTLAFFGFFIASQYVSTTNDCTVTALVAFNGSSAHRKMYRVHTAECGTLTVSAVPLRGMDHGEAVGMYNDLILGEQYEFTYIREGFGVFSVNPSLIDVESVK